MDGLTPEQIAENPGLGWILRKMAPAMDGEWTPPVETCCTVFPKHDLGQWEEFGFQQMVVYATIENHPSGQSEVRVLFPSGLSNLALQAIRSRE